MISRYYNINFSNNSYKLYYESDEDLISRSCGEILNSEDFKLTNNINNMSTVSSGLYDTQVFGTVNKCVCGKVKYEGYCPYCKTRVLSLEDYTNQIAYYKLLYPYSYPFKLKILLKEFIDIKFDFIQRSITSSSTEEEELLKFIWSLSFEPSKMQSNINNKDLILSQDQDKITFNTLLNGKPSPITVKSIKENSKKEYIGLIGLYKLSDYEFNGKKLNFIKNFITFLIPIVSPALRPPRFSKQNGKILTTLPSIHTDYKTSIELDKIFREITIENSIDFATALALFNILQSRIMYNQSLFRSSKQSLLRNSTSIRIDLTLRGNISPSDELKLNEIGIPKSAMYLMLQHQIIEELKKDKDPKVSLNAEFYYNIQHKKAVKILYDIVENSVVLFQRSPVLFKFGVWALKPVLIESNLPVLKMHPDIATPFNADYDGDQMPVILEYDRYNGRRLLQKMGIGNIWFYDRASTPLWVPDHERLFGLYLASHINPKKHPKKYKDVSQVIKDIENHNIEIDEEIFIGKKKTSYGRNQLDEILGTELDKILGEGVDINADNIAKIISGLANKKNRIDIIDKLSKISNEFATKIGIDSPPLHDFYKSIANEVKLISENPDLSDNQKYNLINEKIAENMKNQIKNLPNSNFYEVMLNSGRIKPQQLHSLYNPKMMLVNGKLDVGDKSIIQGLTERDFYNGAFESRSVFEIKKNLVPINGYFMRQIVTLLNNIQYSKGNAPVKGYVKIPNTDLNFKGRNLLKSDSKFNYYQSIVGRPLDDRIYSDEIRVDKFIHKIKDNEANELEVSPYIAQSFGSQLMEKIQQGLLGLKYGSFLTYTEDESTTALFDGTVVSIDETALVIQDENGKDWNYIITNNTQIPKEIQINKKITKGEVLFFSKLIRETKNDISPISVFLGFQIPGKKPTEENIGVTYALEDCIINYSGKSVVMGDIKQKINQNMIYKYPDGWKLSYGDRISSGILDTKTMLKYINPSDAFYLFYIEFHSINAKRGKVKTMFEPEFLEPLFAVISSSSNKSIKSSAREMDDLLHNMYSNSPKIAFRDTTLKTPIKISKSGQLYQKYKGTYITDLLLRLKE